MRSTTPTMRQHNSMKYRELYECNFFSTCYIPRTTTAQVGLLVSESEIRMPIYVLVKRTTGVDSCIEMQIELSGGA